ARSYWKMWRKPTLDPTYGQTSLATYNTLLGLYPTSPLLPQAQKELSELENWFAIKNYDAGMFYVRRGAYDSAILYFKDVLSRWPNSPTARQTALSLVQAYKAIRYREDASDLCTQLRKKYVSDAGVRIACNGIPDAQALKAGLAAAPAHQRLAMVKLLTGGDDRFAADAVEIERAGLSYTVDTLKTFAQRFPDAERFFLVGEDAMTAFGEWRAPEQIVKLARLAILRRPGAT